MVNRKHVGCWLSLLLISLTPLARGPAPLSAQESASLILSGGRVVTVDPEVPEGTAIAVAGDRILAVGSDEEIGQLATPETRLIDLQGRLAIPGFIEGHGHFTGLGQSRMMLDLTAARSWDEVVTEVEQAVRMTPPGEWIVGRGWHQEKWNPKPHPQVEGYPVHDRISAVSPNNPVMLTHASGHMCFANAYAMQLAEVAGDTPAPEGGEILHDESGKPIGIFRETATSLIKRAHNRDQQKRTAADHQRLAQRAIDLATEECLRKGVTSFQDAGSSFQTIAGLRKLAEQNRLGVRLWVMVRDHPELIERNLQGARVINAGNHFFTMRGIKLSLDGALGAHGAWLLQPYEDLPSSEGLNTAPIATAERLAELAIEHDCQLCIHAIGDRANREVLDIFERAFATSSPTQESRRWRIEHAQHLHPDDIPRFAELGVIASMQGVHCTSDAVFVLQRLGPRRAEEGAYVWQKLLQSGAVVTNGTDAPVEDVDPLASFYASVTRKLDNGAAFFPDQAMSREEALYSYTMACAWAAFEENDKGSLTPGKLADIVVLSNDILQCPEDKIRDTRVDYTIVGGQVAWDAAAGDEEQ